MSERSPVQASSRFLGGMESSVPNQMILSCPLRGASALYCVSGTGILEEFQKTWSLSDGGILLVRSGRTPLLRSAGQPLRILLLLADSKALPAGDGGTAVFAPLPNSGASSVRLFEEALKSLPCEQEDTFLQRFFVKLKASVRPMPADGMRVPKSIRMLRQALDTRYTEKLTLDSLSRELHWNKYKLEKDFKHYCGHSPLKYLLNVRVEEACRLLRNTNRSVLDIGFSVGVENASYFVRMFRKRTGMSPTEYRNHYARSTGQLITSKNVKEGTEH